MRILKAILLKGERYKVFYDSVDACGACDLHEYCLENSYEDNTMLAMCCNLGVNVYFKKEKEGYGDGDARKRQDG